MPPAACRGACDACGALFPERDGVTLLLPPDLRDEDPWAPAAGGLEAALREDLELERRLMTPDPSELGAADRMFRGLVLDERGVPLEAARLAASAEQELYTPGYLACRDRITAAVVRELRDGDTPVVDVASGRCTLVERLARELRVPIVASDLSPVVLQRSRARLAALGVADRVSFLCFDARKTPLADGSVGRMTTNVGLGNVSQPGPLLEELRRVVSGVFYALCAFFPEDDAENAAAASAAGLEFAHAGPTLAAFAAAGWVVETVESCTAEARPTPPGEILAGARVDGLPVAPTVLEWRLLRAS